MARAPPLVAPHIKQVSRGWEIFLMDSASALAMPLLSVPILGE